MGILKDNKYRSDDHYGHISTKDYVKLLAPMKLDEYVVNLNYYPWLEPISPFASWSQPGTTQSLVWYHAYNQVKHGTRIARP
jgi:hypothetical protein